MSQYNSFATYYESLMGDKGDLPNHHLLDTLTLPLLPKKSKLVVLDVGCGNGRWTKALSVKYRKIIGIDIAEGMLEIARNIRPGCNIIYKKMELGKKLFFESSSFDFIFSNMVMHYIADVDNAAGELYRVLKPGGSLLFTTQNETFDLLRYDFLRGIDKRIEFKTKSLKGKVTLKRYFEPNARFIKHFTDAGLILKNQLEPIITKDFVKIYPKYKKYVGKPRFLILNFYKLPTP